MKQTKKLGRGLEDFSHLFLSSPGEGSTPAAVPPGNGQPQAAAVAGKAKTVCIIGERGAGEKTYLAVKVALALAEQGKKVVVFDADFSLPRLCMLMGRVPSNALLTLIANPEQQGARLSESGGMTLVTLDVDVASLGRLTERERLPLAAAIRGSLEEAAVVLIAASGDCMSQISVFLEAADDIAVVAPRPVAEMINAYGVIKKIFQLDRHARVGIVATRSSGSEQADAVFEKMQRVVKKFLDRPLLTYGYLPDDRSISGFLARESLAGGAAPSQETLRCIADIARSLLAGGPRPAAHPVEDHPLTLAEKLFSCPSLHAP